MNKYYILRLGAEFKIIYMDRDSARRWEEVGWELRSQDSNDKAQHAMAEWETTIFRKAPFIVRQQA